MIWEDYSANSVHRRKEPDFPEDVLQLSIGREGKCKTRSGYGGPGPSGAGQPATRPLTEPGPPSCLFGYQFQATGRRQRILTGKISTAPSARPMRHSASNL